MFCPRAGLSLQTQHSPLYPLLSVPLCYVTSCWSKNLMELIFTCGEFLWIPEDPVRQIHSPHPHVGALGIFSDLIRSVHMIKRERDRERERRARSNGKLPHLFIPGKTAVLVPELAVQDLPSTELQHWFLHLPEHDISTVPSSNIVTHLFWGMEL